MYVNFLRLQIAWNFYEIHTFKSCINSAQHFPNIMACVYMAKNNKTIDLFATKCKIIIPLKQFELQARRYGNFQFYLFFFLLKIVHIFSLY